MRRFRRASKASQNPVEQDGDSCHDGSSPKGYLWPIKNIFKKQSPRPDPDHSASSAAQSLIESDDAGEYENKFKLIFLEQGKRYGTESKGDGRYQGVHTLTVENESSFGSYAFIAVKNKQESCLDLYFHPHYRRLLVNLNAWRNTPELAIDEGASAFDCMNGRELHKLYRFVKATYHSGLSGFSPSKQSEIHEAIKLLYDFLRDNDVFEGFGWELLLNHGLLSDEHFKDINAWTLERDLEVVEDSFRKVEQAALESPFSLDLDLAIGEGQAFESPFIVNEEGSNAAGSNTTLLSPPPLNHGEYPKEADSRSTRSDETFWIPGYSFAIDDSTLGTQSTEFGNISNSIDVHQFGYLEEFGTGLQANYGELSSFPADASFSTEIDPMSYSPEYAVSGSESNLNLHFGPGINSHNSQTNNTDKFGGINSDLETTPQVTADSDAFNKESESKNPAFPTILDIFDLAADIAWLDNCSPGPEEGSSGNDFHDSPADSDKGYRSFNQSRLADDPSLSKLDVNLHSQFAYLYEEFMQMGYQIEDSLQDRYEALKSSLPTRHIAWETGTTNIKDIIRKKKPECLRNILCVNMVEAALIGALERDVEYHEQAVLHKEVFLISLELWRMILPEAERSLYNRIICRLWSRIDTVVNSSSSDDLLRPDIGGLFKLVTAFATSARSEQLNQAPLSDGEASENSMARFSGQFGQGTLEGNTDLPKEQDLCLWSFNASPQNGENCDSLSGINPELLYDEECQMETQIQRKLRLNSIEKEPLYELDDKGNCQDLILRERSIDGAEISDSFISLTASLFNVLVVFILAYRKKSSTRAKAIVSAACPDRTSLITKHLLDPLPGFGVQIAGFSSLVEQVSVNLQLKNYQNVFLLLNDIIFNSEQLCTEKNVHLTLIGFIQYGLSQYFSAITKSMRQIQEEQIFQYFGFKVDIKKFLACAYTSDSQSSRRSIDSTYAQSLGDRINECADLSPSLEINTNMSSFVAPTFDQSRTRDENQTVLTLPFIPSPVHPSPPTFEEFFEIDDNESECLGMSTPTEKKRKQSLEEQAPSTKKLRRTLNEDFPCLECKSEGKIKNFSNTQNLKRHVVAKHSGNPKKSKCSHCGKNFSRNYAASHRCKIKA